MAQTLPTRARSEREQATEQRVRASLSEIGRCGHSIRSCTPKPTHRARNVDGTTAPEIRAQAHVEFRLGARARLGGSRQHADAVSRTTRPDEAGKRIFAGFPPVAAFRLEHGRPHEPRERGGEIGSLHIERRFGVEAEIPRRLGASSPRSGPIETIGFCPRAGSRRMSFEICRGLDHRRNEALCGGLEEPARGRLRMRTISAARPPAQPIRQRPLRFRIVVLRPRGQFPPCSSGLRGVEQTLPEFLICHVRRRCQHEQYRGAWPFSECVVIAPPCLVEGASRVTHVL